MTESIKATSSAVQIIFNFKGASDALITGPSRRHFLCREWVFSKLYHCVDSRSQAKTCGTLIIGGPGCGKTVVCQEIACPSRETGKQHKLHDACLAKHFCTAQNIDSLNLPRFVLLLRDQILASQASFVEAYKVALADEEIAQLFRPDRISISPDDAFKRGILLPLLSVPVPKLTHFIMVDSIDESCFIPIPNESSQQQGSKNIAELLATHHQFFPSWLALVCTCRKQTKNVIRLFTGFRKISLDDLRKSHVIRDVQQYILCRLDNEERLRRNLTQETADMLNLLHIKSNGCLLYLETVMDGFSEGFVSAREIADIPGTLNGLFLWLTHRLFGKRHFSTVRPILNVMLASPRPLTTRELFAAVWMRDTTLDFVTFCSRITLMQRVLNCSNSLLTSAKSFNVDNSYMTLFHHSFAEWLMDVKHCTPAYLCSAPEGHTLLALAMTRRAANLTIPDLRLFAHHIIRSCLQPPVKAYHFVLWLINSGAHLNQLTTPNDDMDSLINLWNLDSTAEKLLLAAGSGIPEDDTVDFNRLSANQLDCVRAYTQPPGSNGVSGQRSSSISTAGPSVNNTLCTAAYQGNAAVIALLLAQDADVEVRDRNGSSPLILAARQGHTEVVDMLVKAGAKLDHIDKDGWSALRSAAWGGYVGVVDVLLKGGADPNLTGSDQRTALRAAAWGGHREIVRQLLEFGAMVDMADIEGRTPLVAAAYMGYVELVEMLIDAGADVNHADKDGRTALSVATLCVPDKGMASHAEVVSLLVERGGQVDRTDREGLTPLLVAAYEGKNAVCELLLEWDAHVDMPDRTGRTPLLAAASCGHSSVVQLLLFWGAAIHVMDGEGRSVLSIAASQGNPAVVAELLARGLDEMHRDNAGMTPLHLAAKEGHIDAVKLLLEAGARASEVDNESRTPLLLACISGHVTLASLLMDVCPMAIDIAAHDGRTPLRCACLDDNRPLVQHLLTRGADPNKQDAFGRTTLYMVCLEGLLQMVELLLSPRLTPSPSSHSRRLLTDPSLADEEGRSPLHVAAWQGHVEVADVLVRVGATVDARDREGRTPLQSAAWQGHAQLCRLLIERKARVDMGCAQGATALCIAAQEGHLAVCNVLLEAGANPNHADAYGRTPHRVALKAGHQAVCRLLEDRGAAPSPASLSRTPQFHSSGHQGSPSFTTGGPISQGMLTSIGLMTNTTIGTSTTLGPGGVRMTGEEMGGAGDGHMLGTWRSVGGGSSARLTRVTPLQGLDGIDDEGVATGTCDLSPCPSRHDATLNSTRGPDCPPHRGQHRPPSSTRPAMPSPGGPMGLQSSKMRDRSEARNSRGDSTSRQEPDSSAILQNLGWRGSDCAHTSADGLMDDFLLSAHLYTRSGNHHGRPISNNNNNNASKLSRAPVSSAGGFGDFELDCYDEDLEDYCDDVAPDSPEDDDEFSATPVWVQAGQPGSSAQYMRRNSAPRNGSVSSDLLMGDSYASNNNIPSSGGYKPSALGYGREGSVDLGLSGGGPVDSFSLQLQPRHNRGSRGRRDRRSLAGGGSVASGIVTVTSSPVSNRQMTPVSQHYPMPQSRHYPRQPSTTTNNGARHSNSTSGDSPLSPDAAITPGTPNPTRESSMGHPQIPTTTSSTSGSRILTNPFFTGYMNMTRQLQETSLDDQTVSQQIETPL